MVESNTQKTKSILMQTVTSHIEEFGEEVLQGLSGTPKSLSSKWFYDELGDKFFQGIMASPEYYLTESERDIFEEQSAAFLAAIGSEPFDLIELGAGDGSKTQHLIEHFIYADADFRYLPIDISSNALSGLTSVIKTRWPDLPYQAVQGDYFKALQNLPDSDYPRKKVVLFPGANIGNFGPAQAEVFINKLKSHLQSGDLLIIGFDLKKDPARILAAYNDSKGVTAQFNLNLLTRINRELGGEFDLDQWRHWPTYNPVTGASWSYLVSKLDQSVYIKALDQTFHFEHAEAIDMEISQKYSLKEVEQLAEATGMTVVHHLTDERLDFVDTIWRV
jgi:dimethylhistidine N-methyltransferase